jgi:hypothetical protein
VARAYVNLFSNALTYGEYHSAQRFVSEATAYLAGRDLNARVDHLAVMERTLKPGLRHWAPASNIAMQLAHRRSALPVSRLPALVGSSRRAHPSFPCRCNRPVEDESLAP